MNNIVPMQTVQPIRPRDYSPDQLALVKRTVAKDCNHDEFSMFMEVCRRVGLDPFRRQIYCNVYSKDNPKKRQVVFITGIDGFRAVAARNGNYRPDENEPEIVYDEALKDPEVNPKGILKAVVRAHKQDNKGEWHPIIGVARWDEFAPLREKWKQGEDGKDRPSGEFFLPRDQSTSFWRKMPHNQLAKCAEAQAIRRGWPEDLSGVYAPEEMAQADLMEQSAADLAERAEENRRLALTHAKDAVPFQWSTGEPIAFIPVGQVADKIMAHMKECDSAVGLDWWTGVNREGLRQFWALAPSDALECKKAIEAKRAELDTEAAR